MLCFIFLPQEILWALSWLEGWLLARGICWIFYRFLKTLCHLSNTLLCYLNICMEGWLSHISSIRQRRVDILWYCSVFKKFSQILLKVKGKLIVQTFSSRIFEDNIMTNKYIYPTYEPAIWGKHNILMSCWNQLSEADVKGLLRCVLWYGEQECP